MFLLPRLIVEICTPFIFSILLFCVGTFFLVFNRKKITLICNIVGLSILLFFGYGFWSSTAMQERESAYLPLALDGQLPENTREIQFIAILGSGHVSDPRLPVSAQIGGASLYRLVEGLRLSSMLPDARIVITGGIGYDPVPNAAVVAETAKILGVEQHRLIVKDWPRDTLQEAEALQGVVGSQPFILVTSASHMKRAMDILRQRGMYPIAAPTDYILKQQINKSADSFFPKTGNLDLARNLIYEYMGTLWTKIKTISGNFQ